MAIETLALEHLPASHAAYVALFRGVENAAFLRQQLLDREPEFEYAFVDASVVRAPPLPPAFPASILPPVPRDPEPPPPFCLAP